MMSQIPCVRTLPPPQPHVAQYHLHPMLPNTITTLYIPQIYLLVVQHHSHPIRHLNTIPYTMWPYTITICNPYMTHYTICTQSPWV